MTICSHEKKHIFGYVEDGSVKLNDFGNAVQNELLKSAKIRNEITLDTFIIMPNHLHAIVIIARKNEPDIGIIQKGDPPVAPTLTKRSLGALVAGFKQAATLRMRTMGYTDQLWQRGYYEHIIRNIEDYYACQNYISTNPQRWGKLTAFQEVV